MIKAFFHGRGQHSRGWDGYVMIGQVEDDAGNFNIKVGAEGRNTPVQVGAL